MRIAVMGSGGMGGFFGANLAEAGQDVTFIARGSHLEAIQRHGLLLTGPRGDTRIHPAKATDDPTTIGTADVVLFCVKLYDVEAAAEAIQPLLGPETAVVSVLNGVDGPDRIGRVVGPERILAGAAHASAVIDRPGVVSYKSDMATLIIGELDGSASPRALAFQSACADAEFRCEVSDSILGVLWDKFVLLATNAGLSGLCRQPVAAIYEDPDLLSLATAMLTEVATLAQAQGIAIDPDIVEKSVERSKAFPPDMYASMYHDLTRGRRMELAGLSGKVTALGAALGVPTPHHRTVYACLKPYMDGDAA